LSRSAPSRWTGKFADDVAAAVAKFGSHVTEKLRGGGEREDQLRAPTETLLRRIGQILGVRAVPIGEKLLKELGAKPDYAVDVNGLRVGYVELKAPGSNVPPAWRPDKRNRAQWERLKALPNLIYTDGYRRSLFHYGELSGRIADLEGDFDRSNKSFYPKDDEFIRIMNEFFFWDPKEEAPSTLRNLVKTTAGLCRILREEVVEIIEDEKTAGGSPRPFSDLAQEWRELLFSRLDDRDFADAYAQTVTFALLLARSAGVSFDDRSLADIAYKLGKSHSLMGKSLAVLTDPERSEHIFVIETLRRVIGAIDWDSIDSGESDTYTLLYEHFLETYDSTLRKKSGFYYTPDPVARSMVDFIDEILRVKLDRHWGLASDDVIVVDPSMGTGTFLVEVVRSIANTVSYEEGPEAAGPRLRELFERRLIGFERYVAPYAVAELRLHEALKVRYGVDIPAEEMRFLTNTLDDPDAQLMHFGRMYEEIAKSRRGANRIKREVPVMVVLGNPPFLDRARTRDPAPWIEDRRTPDRPVDISHRPSIDEFRGRDGQNLDYKLSNTYIYFWRWATWKVFDAHPKQPKGIVAFISPSAYTTSSSCAGMREYLRRTADEGWIIDLSPEDHQAPIDKRVFQGVQHPVCIGIFVRRGPAAERSQPANIRHLTVSGNRDEKFAQLERMHLHNPSWLECSQGWQDPFLPKADSRWTSWPLLSDLMPWQTPGVKANRTWVFSPTSEALELRWARLVNSGATDRARLLKVTDDRNLDTVPKAIFNTDASQIPLRAETSERPLISRVAYRSFDRQFIICDARVIDRPRRELWSTLSDRQIYISEQHTNWINSGPGLTFSNFVPDMHHFQGHHGGRAIPLYRDAAGTQPNLAPSLAQYLSKKLSHDVSAEDFVAYVAAIVSHPAYTERFAEQLKGRGIRVPITRDLDLWNQAIGIGREVLWLHTYGERYVDARAGRPKRSPRLDNDKRPRVIARIPDSPGANPTEMHYDPSTRYLHVGDGIIAPVSENVWEYDVGKTYIIRKWFDFRCATPRHRGLQTGNGSPLDSLSIDRWIPQFTTDLLDLINVLGRLVQLEPLQAEVLENVCDGRVITFEDLHQAQILPVSSASRKPPTIDANILLFDTQ
jgi:hypothetical protein